jgi:hypothetical protein
MRLAENESRRVGMKFEALVELSRYAEGMKPVRVHTRDLFRPLNAACKQSSHE